MTNTSRGPSRRTLVKGAAWSVPVVAMAQPVMAQDVVCSPNNTSPECNPVTPPDFQEGSACKHPGNKCGRALNDAYHYVFCMTNNTDQPVVVTFGTMYFDDGRTSAARPSTVTIPANSTRCFTLHTGDMGNSANGSMAVDYSYTYIDEYGEVIPVSGRTPYTGTNSLNPCPDCDGGRVVNLDVEENADVKLDVEEPVAVTESAPADVQAPVAPATPPATDVQQGTDNASTTSAP